MISVAMAVYNGETYLEKQLDSILSQTERVNEIVIVDDASTDCTPTIIRTYQKEHPQISFFQNEKNLGYKQTFRKAISLCHGDIIFLCDQDDYWLPDKVRLMHETIEMNTSIQVLASSFEFINSDGKMYKVKPRKGMSNNNMYLKPVAKDSLVPVTFEEFCSHNYFQGCSMLVSRAIAKEYLENWSNLLPHDWLIALIASHQQGFYFLNKPLFYYRTHSNNTIGVPRGGKAEEWVRLKFAEDMRCVMQVIQTIWPEEYKQNPKYQKRADFCASHINALKKRDTFRLIKQNGNPVYHELKSTRARLMDLLFSIISKPNV